jgi:uncharacterized protein (TIGR02599 family)
VELLVSMAVLALLLVLVAQALAMTHRSWMFTHASAEMQRTVEDIQAVLSRHIGLATLQPRMRFDEVTGAFMPESDLHFVCGPAAALLSTVPGTCSDAVFFQHAANADSLKTVMQACGFFVQYGDEATRQPAFIKSAISSRRFRLMQFHQSASSLTIFRHPALSTITRRSELYEWFVRPVADSPINHVSIVAENVLAMSINPHGGLNRYHDTRRHQWEEATAEANASQHRLPESLSISLLVTDEASWSKLSSAAADTLAKAVIQRDKDQAISGTSTHSTLESLREMMATFQLRTRLVSLEIHL